MNSGERWIYKNEKKQKENPQTLTVIPRLHFSGTNLKMEWSLQSESVPSL